MFRAERGHRGEVQHPHLTDAELHLWPRPEPRIQVSQAFPTKTLAAVEFMENRRLCT